MSNRWTRAFYSPERVELINSIPCVVCGSLPSENAHLVSRGAGGEWEDIVPLCWQHHREQHDTGLITFLLKYSLDQGSLRAKFSEIVT